MHYRKYITNKQNLQLCENNVKPSSKVFANNTIMFELREGFGIRDQNIKSSKNYGDSYD